MIRARTRVLLIAALLLVAGAAFAFTHILRAEAPPERPKLLLLTSLPLVFGEQFSLQDAGSPALKALQGEYRVLPISVTDPRELAKGRLLLMAHPLAQPAEDLVALDEWVRRGGRVLLLADPMLDWPSERPLGDPLRPPPMFMDTGLLGHWGLRLDAPEKRGVQPRKLGGKDILTSSPGSLQGGCAISADRLVARCRIGKGRATVVADADLLDTDHLGQSGERNLDALLAELASLAND
jgi:hypothetical protein